MAKTERRQAPRMTVNGHAYVNLDPNNGGVILNISEGGLCFQSTAPIQRTEMIRLWFSYRSHRIEAAEGLASTEELRRRGVSRYIEVASQMAWTDQTGKTGGLCFLNLPPDAREQIRDWIRQASLVAKNEKAALSPPKAGLFHVRQSITNAARQASARLAALYPNLQSGRPWTGFSGGLLVGVLVSTLAVTVFSLFTHSRELGDTLIRLGERLGGRSWSQPISLHALASSPQPHWTSPAPAALASSSVSPDSHPAAPESQDITRAPQAVSAAPMQAPLPEKLVSTATLTAISKASGVNLKVASPATPSLSARGVKPTATPALSSTAGGPLSPGITIAPTSDPSTSMLESAAPEMELANRTPGTRIAPSKVEDIGMRSEKYLAVGRFKEKLLADKTTGQLSQLGFPATVIQWNRLWGKSYQVLVGPYKDDDEAEAAHKDLASLGFASRSYERGRREFTLPPALKVAGTHLPSGDCMISWESYAPDAVVKIKDNNGIGITVEGRWVKQGVRYTQNAVGYQKNRDGSRTLIEIRFAGMNQALVFGNN